MPSRHTPSDYERVAHLLGIRVATLRGLRGLTQEGLAERTGLSRNQIQNIERNRNNQQGFGNPRLETIVRLAVALEVDATYLISSDLQGPSTSHPTSTPAADPDAADGLRRR